MKKYRFKTKEEFIRDGLWDEKYNCPDRWNFDGEMNKYLGIDVPDELNVYCDKNEEFEYDNWLFRNTDYVLKEQQKYFDDLSQHIGRYIRALVDYPHSGRVKEGEIGKIISNYNANFPSQKHYSCTNALSKGVLGVKYELMPKDYSPEQKPSLEFIPGKWYKVELSNKFNHYIKVDSVTEDEIILDCEGYVANLNKWNKGTSINLKTVTKYDLLTDLSVIQKYLPEGHPNKVTKQKFEIGKWYKWYQKNHGNYHYGKVKEINLETNTLVMTPWILHCTDYNYSGTFDLSKAEQIQEISIEQIQEFLPKGYVDKISKPLNDKIECTEFKKGEYIVLIDKGQSTSSSDELILSEAFIQNHCYKVKENGSYLMTELDSAGGTTNGWVCIPYNPNKYHKNRNWRYATQEEIDEYERRGKPYDVTELEKSVLSMEEIQEECKKRFPIGCTYISTNGETHVLKKDSRTYTIVEQKVWAHSGAECLYKNGKWATLVSLPEKNNVEVPEYIECTETQESYFIKGNVYKVIDSNNLRSARLVSNIELSQMSAGTSLFCSMESYGKKYWKPSTKEAYEQQKTLTYESVSGCFPTDKTMLIYDEVGQYPSTFSDYWKNVSIFVEKEFDIYGPTPDIE